MAPQPAVLLSDLAARLAVLEDERAIRTTLERYGKSLDYGQEADFVDCFTADGVYELKFRTWIDGLEQMYAYAHREGNNIKFIGRDVLAQYAAQHTRAPAMFHKHVVVHHTITRGDDPNAVSVSSYFMRIDEASGHPLISSYGRYLDKLTRSRDGKWRFTERICDIEVSLSQQGAAQAAE